MQGTRKRVDYDTIVRMIPRNATVLDLGCGSGRLLERLKDEKNTRGQGVEIDHENVKSCIRKGLDVYQGDLNEGLKGFQAGSMDHVILNHTLQYLHEPKSILEQMLSIGKYAIVGVQNLSWWGNRLSFLISGNLELDPFMSNPLQENTPQLITITQFMAFCKKNGINILQKHFLTRWGELSPVAFPNLLAETAIFMLEGNRGTRLA
ncbi:methyltransferase domain-containing protein [Candidatus Bathyarchaeota archaeon]|nr:methyltransferase domain-containing protein [Candidatus Bathyarchaeota archaeon]